MVETFCTSGTVKSKAGKNVSVDITGAEYTEWINQAESAINIVTGVDYTATYATLTASKQKILEDGASSYAAMTAISYNPNAWSLRTAQTKLDANWTRYVEIVKLLKEKKNTDFLSKA